jgi:hypothetical protein
MAKKQTPDGFDTLLADHKKSTHHFEEADGTHRLWKELSAEGKLAYIARDAALYDVPFDRFAQAVRDVLGGQPAAVREEAALRLALSNERQLHALAALLPPERSGTESTPLVERFKEVLDQLAERAAKPPETDEDRGTQAATLRAELFGASAEPGQEETAAPGMVHFKGFLCEMQWTTYPNGRAALYLVEAQTREMVAVATANLPEAPLKPGEVFIKDHSENRGMLAALEQAGVVKATGAAVRSGFVEVPVAALLPGHGPEADRRSTLRTELFAEAKPQPEPPPQPERPNERQHKH